MRDAAGCLCYSALRRADAPEIRTAGRAIVAHSKSNNVDALLSRVIQADRALREAREAFLESSDERELISAIAKEIDRAWSSSDAIEGQARLIRMAELLTEIGGASAARLLVRILDHSEPAVRVAAGEGLVELGYDRYADVARAIEAEVDKGTAITALCEAPFVLADLEEPGGIKICTKLLKHENPDVVGAAIEALAQFGDPSVLKDIEPLKNDQRVLTLEEDNETGEVRVGDLASEAIEHLKALKACPA